MSLPEHKAWIIHEKRMYWARGAARAGRPASATVLLLQGLFDQFRDHSFFILRNRVFLDYLPSEMDLGMLKLVAKRWSVGTSSFPEGLEKVEIQGDAEGFYFPTLPRSSIACNHKQIQNSRQAEEVLESLEAQVPRVGDLHDQSRKVAAVLTDEFGEILETSVHQGSINKTLHAEVDLLQRYSRRLLDFRGGYRLYVSLKPCHMCAGMIHHCGIKNVFYRTEDSGPKSRGTVLDRTETIKSLTHELRQ